MIVLKLEVYGDFSFMKFKMLWGGGKLPKEDAFNQCNWEIFRLFIFIRYRLGQYNCGS